VLNTFDPPPPVEAQTFGTTPSLCLESIAVCAERTLATKPAVRPKRSLSSLSHQLLVEPTLICIYTNLIDNLNGDKDDSHHI